MELYEAWSPPKSTLEETKVWEIVITTTTTKPCSLANVIGIPTMHSYRVEVDFSSAAEGMECPNMCASNLTQDMDITKAWTTAESDPDWELPPEACWQGATPSGSSPPENCVSSGESHHDP